VHISHLTTSNLLVRFTANGITWEAVHTETSRFLVSLCIFSIETNILSLFRPLTVDVFASDGTWTTFIDNMHTLIKLVQIQIQSRHYTINSKSIEGRLIEPDPKDGIVILGFQDHDYPPEHIRIPTLSLSTRLARYLG
jgi:hypothetical protein